MHTHACARHPGQRGRTDGVGGGGGAEGGRGRSFAHSAGAPPPEEGGGRGGGGGGWGGRKEVSEKYNPISLYQSHLIGNLYKQ